MGQCLRDKIVKAGLELLAEQNPLNMSLRSIAGRVGVTPAAIYRYFKSKAELDDAIRRVLLEDLYEQLMASKPAIEDIIGHYIDFAHERPAAYIFALGMSGAKPVAPKLVDNLSGILKVICPDFYVRASLIASLLGVASYVAQHSPLVEVERMALSDYLIRAYAEELPEAIYLGSMGEYVTDQKIDGASGFKIREYS